MSSAAHIRQRVASLGHRSRGARVPEALRGEIAQYARRRRAQGASLREISIETGVSPESVRRWTFAPRRRHRAADLLPVEVIAESSADGVVIVTPGGYRIEGLDVERAADLLRHLG